MYNLKNMALNTLENRMDSLEQDLVDLAISTKEGFDEMRTGFQEMRSGFEQVNIRLDRIENISIGGHERRIENLEDRMRVVETKTKIRKK